MVEYIIPINKKFITRACYTAWTSKSYVLDLDDILYQFIMDNDNVYIRNIDKKAKVKISNNSKKKLAKLSRHSTLTGDVVFFIHTYDPDKALIAKLSFS